MSSSSDSGRPTRPPIIRGIPPSLAVSGDGWPQGPTDSDVDRKLDQQLTNLDELRLMAAGRITVAQFCDLSTEAKQYAISVGDIDGSIYCQNFRLRLINALRGTDLIDQKISDCKYDVVMDEKYLCVEPNVSVENKYDVLIESSSESSVDADCCICLEDDCDFRLPCCGSVIHNDCLWNNFLVSSRCPLCRRDFSGEQLLKFPRGLSQWAEPAVVPMSIVVEDDDLNNDAEREILEDDVVHDIARAIIRDNEPDVLMARFPHLADRAIGLARELARVVNVDPQVEGAPNVIPDAPQPIPIDLYIPEAPEPIPYYLYGLPVIYGPNLPAAHLNDPVIDAAINLRNDFGENKDMKWYEQKDIHAQYNYLMNDPPYRVSRVPYGGVIGNLENRNIVVNNWVEHLVPQLHVLGFLNDNFSSPDGRWNDHYGVVFRGIDKYVSLPLGLVAELKSFLYMMGVRKRVKYEDHEELYENCKAHCIRLIRELQITGEQIYTIVRYAPMLAYRDSWRDIQESYRLVSNNYFDLKNRRRVLRFLSSVRRFGREHPFVTAGCVFATVYSLAFLKVKVFDFMLTIPRLIRMKLLVDRIHRRAFCTVFGTDTVLSKIVYTNNPDDPVEVVRVVVRVPMSLNPFQPAVVHFGPVLWDLGRHARNKLMHALNGNIIYKHVTCFLSKFKPFKAGASMRLPGPDLYFQRTAKHIEFEPKKQFVYGFDNSYRPIAFSNSYENEITMLKARVLAQTPIVDIDFMNRFVRFVKINFRKFFHDASKIIPMSNEKYLQSTNSSPSVKRQLRKQFAEMKLHERGADYKYSRNEAKFYTTRSCFIKVENLLYHTPGGIKEKSARPIQGAHPEFICQTGPFVASLAKRVKKLWNKDFVLTFSSGVSFRDMAIDLIKASGYLLKDDIGAFDSSVSSILGELEIWIMEKFGASPAILQFARANLKTHGRTFFGIKYRYSGGRKSGDPWTSLMNTILNGLMHVFILVVDLNLTIDEVFLLCRMKLQGDDNVLRYDHPKRVDFRKYMLQLGFDSEAEYCSGPEDVEFCSCRLYPTSHGYVFAPKFARVISKLGYFNSPPPELTPVQLMRGTALGLLPSCHFIPPLCVFLNRILQLTDGVSVPAHPYFKQYTKDNDWNMVGDGVYSYTCETENFLFYQYQWSPFMTTLLTKFLSTCIFSSSLNNSMLWRVFDIDTNGPQLLN